MCFFRGAGDSGFCCSRWPSDIQNLWEGEKQSRFPDGETKPITTTWVLDSHWHCFLEQGTADPDRALTVARLMWVLPLNWTLFQRKLSQFSSTLITKNVGAFQNRRSIRQATTLKACLLFFCFQFSGFYDLGEPEPSWTRALRFPTIHFLNILTQNKQMENTKYLDICKLAIITVDLYSIHPKTCSNVVSVPVFEMF